MQPTTRGALVVFGSGPGIGTNVASLFAANGFDHVFLVSRNTQRLEVDRTTLLEQSGRSSLTVDTITADISDRQSLAKALNQINSTKKTIGAVFFNAARIEPTPLLSYSLDEVERDFQVTNIALLEVVRWAHPILEANVGKVTKPAVLVTNSFLYKSVRSALFSLTAVKAAQRALVQCLNIEFATSGVHYGLVSVGGPVSDDEPARNAKNIAQETWKFYNGSENNELEIEIA